MLSNDIFIESIQSMDGLDDDMKESVIKIREECVEKQTLYEALPALAAVPFIVKGITFAVNAGMLAWSGYDIYKWITEGDSDDTSSDSADSSSEKEEPVSSGDVLDESEMTIRAIFNRAMYVAQHTSGGIDDKIRAIVSDEITTDIISEYGKEVYHEYKEYGFVLNTDGTVDITDIELFKKSFHEKTGLDDNFRPIPTDKEKGEATLKRIIESGINLNVVSPAVLLMNEEDARMFYRTPRTVSSGGGIVDTIKGGIGAIGKTIKDAVGYKSVDISEYPDPHMDIVEGYKNSPSHVQHMMKCRLYRNENGVVDTIPDDKWSKLQQYIKSEQEAGTRELDKKRRDLAIRSGRIPLSDMTEEEKKLLYGETTLYEKWNKSTDDKESDIDESTDSD